MTKHPWLENPGFFDDASGDYLVSHLTNKLSRPVVKAGGNSYSVKYEGSSPRHVILFSFVPNHPYVTDDSYDKIEKFMTGKRSVNFYGKSYPFGEYSGPSTNLDELVIYKKTANSNDMIDSYYSTRTNGVMESGWGGGPLYYDSGRVFLDLASTVYRLYEFLDFIRARNIEFGLQVIGSLRVCIRNTKTMGMLNHVYRADSKDPDYLRKEPFSCDHTHLKLYVPNYASYMATETSFTVSKKIANAFGHTYPGCYNTDKTFKHELLGR